MKDLDFLIYNDLGELLLEENNIREKQYIKHIRNCFNEALKQTPKKLKLEAKKCYFKGILDDLFRNKVGDSYEDLIWEDSVYYGDWNGIAYHKYRLYNRAEIKQIKFKYKNIFK